MLTDHGCKVAPNTYLVFKKRRPSARSVRDEYLKEQVARVRAENLEVYGADMVSAALNRVGTRGGPLHRGATDAGVGLVGIPAGQAFKVTSRHDDRQHRPADLVERQFKAPAPNRLWVAGLTYVKTHAGWGYAAFAIDVYSRMVVGWQISNSLRSDLAIDALEMAMWNRTRAGQVLDNPIHRSDRGVQLVYPQGPWSGLDDVEFATLGYIDWFNDQPPPARRAPRTLSDAGLVAINFCR